MPIQTTPKPLPAIFVIVIATLALVFDFMGWWIGGLVNWSVLTGAIGVWILGLALLVGPRRRAIYYALLGTSVGLSALSLWMIRLHPVFR
jgi:hypothetical protein